MFGEERDVFNDSLEGLVNHFLKIQGKSLKDFASFEVVLIKFSIAASVLKALCEHFIEFERYKKNEF